MDFVTNYELVFYYPPKDQLYILNKQFSPYTAHCGTFWESAAPYSLAETYGFTCHNLTVEAILEDGFILLGEIQNDV